MKQLNGVIELLGELKDDRAVPRNVRGRITDSISNLRLECEEDIKVSRLLNDLEEISEDPNLPSYTRTEILSIISILEEI
ncbi:UPF0147 family protein [Candidatus Woesearchaeota archaeon]|nr:UPF0147 family protein [Candidatus Woesearchaeota archaeon]